MPTRAEQLSALEKQLVDLEGQIETLAKSDDDGDTGGHKSTVKRVRIPLAKAKKAAKDDADDDYEDMDDDEDDDMDKNAKTAKSVKKAADDKSSVKKADDKGDAKIDKAADEELEFGGVKVTKSAVGESAFALLKAQSEDLTKAKQDIAKERDLRVTSELSKKADDLYKHVVGTTDEKVGMLKAMAGMDEPVRKSFEKVLETLEKMAGTAFDTIGKGAGQGVDKTMAKAQTDFMAKAAEIKKRDNCSHQEAMQKARSEHPDLFQAYQGDVAN